MKKSILATLSLLTFIVVAIDARAQTMTAAWDVRAGTNKFDSANTTRQLTYNPFTGNIIYVSRVGGVTSVNRVKGVDGTALSGMSVSGISGGTIVLNSIAAAEDGVIYAANVVGTTTTVATGLKIYRWANESATPTVIYNATPSSGVNGRWGDTITVRGSGAETQILVGCDNSNQVGLLTTANGTTFTFTRLPITQGNNFYNSGLAFSGRTTNSFWGRKAGNGPMSRVTFTTSGTAQTVFTNSTVLAAACGIAFDDDNDMFFAVSRSSSAVAHSNVLYTVNASLNGVTAVRTNLTPTTLGDGGAAQTGAAFGTGRAYGLVPQNGIFAWNISTVPRFTAMPVASQTVAAEDAVSMSVTAANTSTYQWRLNGSNISGATDATYNIASATGSDAGNYTCLITSSSSKVAISSVSQLSVSPTISVQPASETKTAYESVTLSVTADGQAPLAYQWKKGGVNVSGATSSSYAISPVLAEHAGTYTVTITNAAGSVTSDDAVLTVNKTDQTITFDDPGTHTYGEAPISLIAAVSSGLPVTFEVTSGPATVSGSSLTITGTGSVTVRASNAGNDNYNPIEQSRTFGIGPATLTVIADDKSRVYGASNPTLTVTYSGFAYSDTAGVLSGSPALSTLADESSAVSTYTITVTAGTLSAANYEFTMQNGVLTVNPAETTTTVTSSANPSNPDEEISFTATIAAVAPGTGTPSGTVQFYIDGTPFGDPVAFSGTAASDTITTLTPGNHTILAEYAGNSNFNGSTNSMVQTVRIAPTIDTDPASSTNDFGSTVLLSVVASGTGPFDYQWRKDASDLSNSGNVSGALSSTLSLSSVTQGDVADYDVIVSNPAGSVTSAVATVTLIDPVITVQPANQTNDFGSSALFSVTAVGTAPLSIQWRKGDNDLLDETNATLTLTSLTQTDATNYSVVITNDYGAVTSSIVSLTVVEPVITVQPENDTVAWGGSAGFSVTAIGTGTLGYQWKRNGTDISGATTSSLTLDPVVTSDATTYTVQVTSDYGTNLSDTVTLSVTPTVTTHPASQTKTVEESVTFSVVAEGPATLSYQWKKNGVSISGATSDSLTINSVVAADAADYTVEVSNAAGSTTSNPATLTVNKANQSISFTAISNKTYGDAPFAVSASASSGLAVSFDVVSGPATASGNTITITGAGTVEVEASQAGNADYNPAANVTNSFTVAKATLTVTAANKTKTYGASNPGLTHSFSGFVYSDTDSVVTGSPSISTTATGSSNVAGSPYTISIAVGTLAADNYDFSFTDGQLTITKAPLTVTAGNETRTYGASNPSFTASYSGFVLSEDDTVITGAPSITTTAIATSSVAGSPYAITPTLGTLAADNYEFTTFDDGELTITKASLSVTADNTSKTYGAANPSFTASYSGFVNAEDDTVISGAPAFSTTATGSSTVAGSPYSITPTLGTLSADNYEFSSFFDGELTVTKATLTVSADTKTKTYGSSNPSLTYSYSGFVLGEDDTVVSGTPSLSTSADSSSTVAGSPYAITINVSGLGADNYQFSGQAGELSVTAAPLTVTANDTNRLYGAANPTFTASFSGFVLSETDAVISGEASFSTDADALSSVAGSPYTVTPTVGTLSAANYAFTTFVDGELTIDKTPLTVTADNQIKVYGSSNPTLTVSYSGFVNGENASELTGSPDITTSVTESSGVAGSPYAITVEIGTLAAANYELTNFVNGVFTVTPATITATADNKTKVYGAAVPALTYSYSGFVLSETESVISGTPNVTTTATSSSSVSGSPYVITVDVSPLSAANYEFDGVNAELTVTKAMLTVTADNKARGYGQANPSFTYNVTGFVLSEDETVLSGSPALSTAATETSAVSGSPYAIAIGQGTLASGNYDFSFVNGTLTINTVPLTITSDNASRGYGDVNPAFSGSVVGLQNSDNITATYDSGTTTNSPIGTYVILQSLVDPDGKLPNYSVTTNNGDLTVTQAVLTVTADDACRPTGAINPSLSGTIDGTKNNETITATYSTTALTESPVGTYPIEPAVSGVTLSNYNVTTVNGTLTVMDAPTISLAPVSKVVSAGDTVVFTGNATGDGTLAFQWKKNGVDLSGETGTSLTLNSVLCSDQGTYAFAVNNCGGTTTASATLTINDPIIVTQPLDATHISGETATFTVTAGGTGPFTYQWRLNGLNLTGATGSALVLNSVQASAVQRYYSCRVTGNCGSIISSNAVLVVNVPPTISRQPVSLSRTAGQIATFTVTATASTPITYQWQRDSVDISGSTASSYTIDPVNLTDAANYRVVMTASGVSTDSTVAVLSVAADGNAPTITLVSPAKNAIVSGLIDRGYTLHGTAKDDARVAQVYYDLNGAGFLPATLTNSVPFVNWTAPVTLEFGTNTLSVKSVDYSSNTSAVTSISFFYGTNALLTLNVNGDGSYTGVKTAFGTPTNGASLQIGRSYTVKAFVGPGTNSLFTNWTDNAGVVLATNPNYSFLMLSNHVLNANFIENPFTGAAGIYNGLVYDTNGVAHESSGFATIRVSRQSYSGKLIIGGNSVPVSGKFDLPGTTVKTFSRAKHGKGDITLTMSLDFANGSKKWSGTVATTNWTADLLCDRAMWNALTNPAVDLTNKYTMLLEGFTNAAAGPAGSGYGLVTVDLGGKVRVSGAAADRAVLAQRVSLSENGEWPLFVGLYRTMPFITNGAVVTQTTEYMGALMGWLTFSTNEPYSTNLAPRGVLNWISKGGTNLYPNGFTNSFSVASSRFVPPLTGTRAVNLTNANFSLTDGDLLAPLTIGVTLRTDNIFTVPGNAVTFKPTLKAATGLLGGSFKHPDLGAQATFMKGAVLQDQVIGGGFFLGTSQGGKITLEGN